MDGGGTIENFDFNLLGKSYLAVTLRTATDVFSVLCNGVHPYLAFIPPSSIGAVLPDPTFLSPTHIAALFSAYTEFQPLDADWLNAEVHAELLEDLGSAELKQVTYWKPQRVGEVIFNHWD